MFKDALQLNEESFIKDKVHVYATIYLNFGMIDK